MTFPRTISLTSSVYSEARDAGYDDLEFALPERTALFVLGRHLLGERRKLIHLHFYSFFSECVLSYKKNEGRFIQGICLLYH